MYQALQLQALLRIWTLRVCSISIKSIIYPCAWCFFKCFMQACPLPDDKIVVYGGEDSHRRPLADAYVLDLQVRIESTGSLDCHTRHWWVGGRMHACC